MKRFVNPGLNSLNRIWTKEHSVYRIKIGTIERVDYENMLCDISYSNALGSSTNVLVSFPYWSDRSFMGVMPEVGCQVVCAFFDLDINRADPVIVAVLPNKVKASINHDLVPGRNSPYNSQTTPSVRTKFQKLYPGEALISSRQGSDIRLDKDITLSNSKLSEFILRSSDHSIIQGSLQYYRSTDAGKYSEGMVSRFYEERYNEDGAPLGVDGNVHHTGTDAVEDYNRRVVRHSGKTSIDPYSSMVTPDPMQRLVMLSDGRYQWIRTLSGTWTIDDGFLGVSNDPTGMGARPLVESRRELRELGDSLVSNTEENVGIDFEQSYLDANGSPSRRTGNIIESVEGTLVGYNFYSAPDLYGKVLYSRVFPSPVGAGVSIEELPVATDYPDSASYPNVRTRAVAKMWKMPFEYAQTRFYVNKEGYINFHVGSIKQTGSVNLSGHSENRQIGAGRSIDGSIGGSVKLVIDKNVDKEESLDVTAIGKTFLRLGCDDGIASHKRRRVLIDGAQVEVGVQHPVLSLGHGATRRSLEAVMDGGVSLRIGKHAPKLKRNFVTNGYTAKGDHFSSSIPDASSPQRDMYADGQGGDIPYLFHHMHFRDLGARVSNAVGSWNGPMVSNPDYVGGSLDVHSCGDIWLRAGRDDLDGRSLTLDLAGGIAAALGADQRGNRSIQAMMDGGIELSLGKIKGTGNSVQGYFSGGIDLKMDGPLNLNYLGDINHNHKGDKSEAIAGSHVHQVSSARSVKVGSDQSHSIMGTDTHNIAGSKSTFIANTTIAPDAHKTSILVGSSYMGTLLGNHTHETIVGNISSKVIKGDVTHSTALGDIKGNTLVGNVSYGAVVGNTSLSSILGNISVSTKAGDAKMETLAGNVTVSTLTGVATLEGLVKTIVKAAVQAEIEALNVVINSPNIQLGGQSAFEPVPKGLSLLKWLATHTHGTTTGPSTPPVIPPTPDLLSVVSKTV